MDDKPINLEDLDHDTLPPIKRGGASLVIAIIVSAVFLLGAVGIAVWLYAQKQNTAGTIQPTDTTKTKDVKSVSWLPPMELPANYVKQDQNTREAATTYYYDDATICGLTATVTAVTATSGTTAKEAVLNLTKAGALSGVTVASSADGPSYTLHDVDGQDFPFESLDVVQDVDVQNVSFKKQNNVVAFKQFGSHLASLGMTCKADMWNAKKAELESLLKQFTLKLER